MNKLKLRAFRLVVALSSIAALIEVTGAQSKWG